MAIKYKGKYIDTGLSCNRKCKSNISGTCMAMPNYEIECRYKYLIEQERKNKNDSEN